MVSTTRNRKVRNSNPFFFKVPNGFIDQEIIPTTDEDRCLFQNKHIRMLKESGLLPAKAVIRPFDARIKADFASEEWVCFFYYPFSIGLSYPFSSFVQSFFNATGFSYSQVMPMVWRVLTTIERLNKTHHLSIGIPEITATYNLRTHGSFRYCLQSKSSRLYMVPNATSSDSGWKHQFFFVRRDSIPNGKDLPVTWVHKDIVKPREDSDARLKLLFKIPEKEREFRVEAEEIETSNTPDKDIESMASDMTKTKPFCLVDLSDMIEDSPVKQENSKTVSARTPTTRLKSAAQKKRKTTSSAENDLPADLTVGYAFNKLQTLFDFLKSKYQEVESSKREAEASKHAAESKLADLLKAISIKDLLLKKKDKELDELKTSFESEKKELIEDAKKCAAASILESMLKMSGEVQAMGYQMTSWNPDAWRKKLAMLKGENAEEEDTAGTSGIAKDDGADVEELKDKTGTEKGEGEGAGDKVGDEKLDGEKLGA